MALIVVWTFFVTIGLWLLSVPLFYAAWKRQRSTTIRNFALSAFVIGIFCGTLATVSDRQVEQCVDAGGSQCFDSGAAGMQLTLITFYLLITWIAAYAMYRD